MGLMCVVSAESQSHSHAHHGLHTNVVHKISATRIHTRTNDPYHTCSFTRFVTLRLVLYALDVSCEGTTILQAKAFAQRQG